MKSISMLLPFSVIFIFCTYPYVPPGNLLHIDSPMTLKKGQISLSMAGGDAQGIFDYGVKTGWLRCEYGLDDDLELGVSSFINYQYQKPWPDITIPPRPSYSLIRASDSFDGYSLCMYGSFKYSLIPRLISFDGGIGFGFYDLGSYYNLGVGMIVGWDNRFLVPFISGQLCVGIPIDQMAVILSKDSSYIPSTTIGFGYNLGLKLPVSSWSIPNDNSLSVNMILGYFGVKDLISQSNFIIMGLGTEFLLRDTKNNK